MACLQTISDVENVPGNYTWWAVQYSYSQFLPRDAMLSAVHAVVVCLSARLSVRLQIMPHDRPGTLVFKWDVL